MVIGLSRLLVVSVPPLKLYNKDYLTIEGILVLYIEPRARKTVTLSLRSLRNFVAVASAGSVSAAAESQHIAQPALSVQIKQLEQHLGTPLFERHPRGVALTHAGQRFLEHAKEILRRVDVAQEDIRSAIDEPSGCVAIALPLSVGKYLTVPLVKEVVATWPKIRLQMIEMSTGYIPDQLLRGNIDLGITFGVDDDARIKYTHLLDEELVFVTSGHTSCFSDAGTVSLRSLAAFPMILPTAPHSLRRRIEAYLAQEQCQLNVVAEVNTISELIELTAAGVGSTILSYASVQGHSLTPCLAVSQITAPRMTRSIYSCRPGIQPTSIAASKIGSSLKQLSAAL